MSTRTLTLRGAKGSSAPFEATDTLRATQRAQIVDLLGEGQIGGLVNGLRSVYIDGVPVENADASRNFPEFGLTLTLGGPTSEADHPFADVQTEVGVGVTVLAAVPVVRTITDATADAVRVTLQWPQLLERKENGDVVGAACDFAIDIQSAGGGYVERWAETVSGKASAPYPLAVRLSLVDVGPAPWDVRVRRVTADSGTADLVDAFSWASYTVVSGVRMLYRNSAVARLEFDAKNFTSIPQRWYDVMGISDWDIPVNYDPLARTVSGPWNGLWKQGWTNNPAWVIHNLVKHPRYGLGDYVVDLPDKWVLYQLSLWCDEMLDDGRGGTEPRYSINVALVEQQEALRLLQEICSVFRGVLLHGGSSLTLTWDAPGTPVASFTPANVVDGLFTYADGSSAAKKTSCTCWYSDRWQAGKRIPTTWDDDALVTKYGLRNFEINPIGVATPGQALRMAKWALYTAHYEEQTVAFRVAAEGQVRRPGEVFQITDPSETGERLGGRIHAATTTTVELDAPVLLASGETYTLWVTQPHATDPGRLVLEGRTVTTAAGTVSALAVTPAFSAAPVVQTVWLLEGTDVAPTLWRFVEINPVKGDGGREEYEVLGVRHEPGKWDLVEHDQPLTISPTRRLRYGAPPVASVDIEESLFDDALGNTHIRATVSWPIPAPGLRFVLSWRGDNGPWLSLPPMSDNLVDFDDMQPGFYEVQVQSMNSLGQLSPPTSASALILGDLRTPPNVAGFTAAIKPSQVLFGWAAKPGVETELRYSAVPGSWASATFLWVGSGTDYKLARPANGTYRVWAAHSKNSFYSATPVYADITVDDSIDPSTGESVYVEYSVDGSTAWHTTFTTGDLWARWKIGLAGAWGDPFKIVGEDGSAGGYIDFIFRRAASLPSTPTGDTPAGWSDAPPAANGNPLWASTGAKTPAGTLVGVWSTPVQIEGDAGTPGQNSAIVYAYRRNATAPGGPSLTCTYTFSTKTLTGLNNSWTTTVPAGTDTLWVIAATAADTDDSDTIASTDWSTPQQLSGNDGGDGLNSATVWLFQRTGSATAPSLPGSTLTYTFSTGVLSGTLGSWTQAVPAPAGGAYLHVTTATAVSSGATDTIASGEWAAVRLLSQDGTGGTDGLRGSLKGYAYGQYGISDSSWSDGHANRTINNMLTGATLTSTLATTSHLRIGDTVIEGNGTTWSQEKFWSGSAWLLPGTVIDGNLLVTGTISGGVNINITGYGKFEGSAAYTVPYYGGSISVDVALAAGTAATPASQVGVYGRTIVSSGAGVMGINTNTSSGDGVYGEGDTGVTGYANSSNATGVRGYGNASALSYAVRASANNTVSGSRGLWADASAAGQIAAYLESTSGTALQVVGTSTFSKQITSTLATGTAPFAVSSTTENANLNAALLKGKTWAAPDPIGATTPSTGRFTTLRVDATPTASGAAVATFSGLLPTGSAASTNSWAPINFNGTQYWVPVWVD